MKITDIKECVKNKNRANIYCDEEFAFALYLDTILSNGLKRDVEISEEFAKEILEQDEKKYALELGIKKISYKMCTKREVEKKLKEKGIRESAIEYAIEKLKEYNYIDDEKYAQMYTEELSNKYGARVIEQKLILKGIDREIAKEYSRQTEQQDDVLKNYIERYQTKYAGLEKRKRDYKTVTALLNKGFNYDDIKRLLSIEDEY